MKIFLHPMQHKIMKYILDHDGKPYNKFFEDISAIPRVSFNEEGISEYLVNFAKERDLWWYRDEIWNVIIKKPASPGYEDHPPVMLQGHTDIVGEKTPDSDFNFDTDPLELYVEDGYLKAKDTTLGADCGHGVAYMLAILDDNSLKHPPIEAFFSVQEEAGIGGPKFVDYSQFTAKKLINTDVMMEGSTYVSTANVIGGELKKPISFRTNDKETFELKIAGLYGGHAAMNIYRDQANAIKLAVRILFNIMKNAKVNIVTISGGTIKNNIPEECVITFSSDDSFENIRNLVEDLGGKIKNEFIESDPTLSIEVSKCDKAEKVLEDDISQEVVELLNILPTGAYKRSLTVDNFVIGSTNMGNIDIEENFLVIGYMFRSNEQSLREDSFDRVSIISKKFNVEFEEEYSYSGYNVSKDAPLNKLFAKVYKEATGKDLEYLYIHGGTDAGTIIENIGDMDVTAIGPNTIDYHRPGEALELASFDRTYDYLITMLSQL